MDNQRNFLLAAALSLGVVFLWQIFFINPRLEREREAASLSAPATPGAATSGENAGIPQAGETASNNSAAVPGSTAKQETEAPRVALKSEHLEGTINLRGARIDDLRLTNLFKMKMRILLNLVGRQMPI